MPNVYHGTDNISANLLHVPTELLVSSESEASGPTFFWGTDKQKLLLSDPDPALSWLEHWCGPSPGEPFHVLTVWYQTEAPSSLRPVETLKEFWLCHLSPHWLPGLIELIWLAWKASPSSLTVLCVFLSYLKRGSCMLTVKKHLRGPFFAQVSTNNHTPLLDPPNKITRSSAQQRAPALNSRSLLKGTTHIRLSIHPFSELTCTY